MQGVNVAGLDNASIGLANTCLVFGVFRLRQLGMRTLRGGVGGKTIKQRVFLLIVGPGSRLEERESDAQDHSWEAVCWT